MTMKRSIREIDNAEVEQLAMANCALMLLSCVDKKTDRPSTGFAYKCKTCNRQFHSFQALGGHMAHHKRLKLMTAVHAVAKHTKHQCSICGLGSGTGQALGGHMRRHRGAAFISTEQAGPQDSCSEKTVPVLKKSNSSKRVICLDLKLGW